MVEATLPQGIRAILSVAVLGLALLAPLRLEGQDPLPRTQEPEDTVLGQEPGDTVLVQEFADTVLQEPEDTVLVPVGPPKPEIYVADLSVFDGLHYLGPL